MAVPSDGATPHLDLPGAYPETPMSQGSRPQSYRFGSSTSSQLTSGVTTPRGPQRSQTPSSFPVLNEVSAPEAIDPQAAPTTAELSEGNSTIVQSTSEYSEYSEEDHNDRGTATAPAAAVAAGGYTATGEKTVSDPSDSPEDAKSDAEDGYRPIRHGDEGKERPQLQKTRSRMTEQQLFKALSRRRSSTAAVSPQTTHEDGDDERAEINRLVSRMFGNTRQESSEEERTRHKGVIFRDLTVKGMGLGAATQPTTGDFFLGLPRFLGNLFTKGPRRAAGKPAVRTLIDGFSGCIKPGEMLLVLGRPGAGCSTFLKVIGNQRFGYEAVEGSVTYGGTDAASMAKKYRSEVLYNPEDDVLFATLKVKDTLKFALTTRTPGKESRKDGESRKDYTREFLRVVSKLFWIEHTLDTKVGNALVRGVSGGEKKRVSIAEAMITKASVQSWDNSTRGLDASTALEYVQSIRALTNMANVSTSVALYQAGESLFELFDKVLLIDGGECCYFGPADQAAAYFEGLGFRRKPRWTTADFLTSVTDLHERQVQDGAESRVPRTARQFGEAFRGSERHRRNLAEVDEFEAETRAAAEEREAAMTKRTREKNYTVSFYKQVVACTHRQFLVMLGDPASLVGKWVGIVFQALIVGALFYDLPQTSAGVFTRGGVIFYILLFNALLALAELTAAFDSREILLKHKSFSFYRPAAFAIAQTVVDVPLVFVQVVLFTAIVYFMANLQRTASQFFIAILILWIITMTMYAFFRAVGALVSSLDVATRITGVALQALIIYTGYLIPPGKMPPWFGWLRWINPIQYGFEGLVANEFYNLEIQCEPPYLVPPNGQPGFQSCALQGSRPGETTVLGADYISVAYSYSRSHLWRNVGFVCAFFLFFVALTAFGMEIQKPNKGGGAVTIFRRGQAPRAVEKALEKGDVDAPADAEAGKEGAGRDVTRDKEAETSEKDDYKPPEGVARNEAIFTWQNVNYAIPVDKGEKQLLQDVQGYVKPGKLTALMGASGAGKTTLLNTLAQRIRFGVVSGDFLVDGSPLPKSFQRSTGFAEQMDVHEPTATVREALRFSAELRQPREVPTQEKHDYCEKIIDLLEMRDIAGAAIGKPGAGLNQEQRKRLTIGVELASKPELLMFLDEPTSGLDSGAAFNIVRFLRKLADAGQAILCTIHQPSSVLFEHFDQLLLLESGGRTVYFGPLGRDSRDLIGYLERSGAKKCPPQANPAEWMLDAIGAGNPDYAGPDYGDIWARSPENESLGREIAQLARERREGVAGGDGSKKKRDDREYAMPVGAQVLAVVRRSFTALWRSPDYVTGMMLLHVFTGLFNAFTFWDVGSSQVDMQSRLFSIFMTLTICPPLIQQLQPRFLDARNVFESREGNAKIYSWFAFTCGAVLSEIPYRLVAGTLYWACWYWPPGFPRDWRAALSMYAFVLAFELYYLGFGQAIAAVCPNELIASLLVPIFFTFIVSFCGVVVPYATLPPFWRDWMYWLSPFKYVLESMLAVLTDGVPVRCAPEEMARFPAPAGTDCAAYTADFVAQAGGYVEALPDGLCGVCQFADGTEFARSFYVFSRYTWRSFGIFMAFAAFNFAVVFVCTYFYLGGWRKVVGALGPGARKGRKEAARRRAEAEKGGERA